VARWTLLANRIGYLCFAVAVAVSPSASPSAFVALVAVVVVSLVVGSLPCAVDRARVRDQGGRARRPASTAAGVACSLR
jgi:hypothetical protein